MASIKLSKKEMEEKGHAYIIITPSIKREEVAKITQVSIDKKWAKVKWTWSGKIKKYKLNDITNMQKEKTTIELLDEAIKANDKALFWLCVSFGFQIITLILLIVNYINN